MRFIDMFCGMGTIRMGFEQAGHECVYSIEWDKHKRRIYEVIFGNEPEGRDITDIRANDLPAADCWCFGAPCQDFSIAGLRDGLNGDRSSLVREVFRLVRETAEEHRPEWLLYENVKGMLSSNKGLDFLEILFEMASLGYDIEYCLVNSKDNGVPQNRERVYTLGHLRSRGERKIFPIGTDNGDPTKKGGGNAPGIAVKQIGNVMPTATRDNPNQGRVYGPTGLAPCLNKMEGGGREPMILRPVRNEYGKAIRKSYENHELWESRHKMRNLEPRADGLSNTLSTVQKDNLLQCQSRIRRLTPRECMRLQGVPDYITDKLIAAGISDSQMYRAAGDACTVNVVYEIAKAMEVQPCNKP